VGIQHQGVSVDSICQSTVPGPSCSAANLLNNPSVVDSGQTSNQRQSATGSGSLVDQHEVCHQSQQSFPRSSIRHQSVVVDPSPVVHTYEEYPMSSVSSEMSMFGNQSDSVMFPIADSKGVFSRLKRDVIMLLPQFRKAGSVRPEGLPHDPPSFDGKSAKLMTFVEEFIIW